MNEEKDIEVLNFASCMTGQCFQKTGLPKESIITEQQKQLIYDAGKGNEELENIVKTSFIKFSNRIFADIINEYDEESKYKQ